MSVVSVWHATTADVLDDDARRASALAWLSPADHARHERYRFEADRDMFLLGRVMARALVGQALGVAPTRLAVARRTARPAGDAIRRPPERSPSTSRTARPRRLRAFERWHGRRGRRTSAAVPGRRPHGPRYCAPPRWTTSNATGRPPGTISSSSTGRSRRRTSRRAASASRSTCPISVSPLAPTRFALDRLNSLSADDDAAGRSSSMRRAVALGRGRRDGAGRCPSHAFRSAPLPHDLLP